MVQLKVKFTFVCSIHACVVQFYWSDLSEPVCHKIVRLLCCTQVRVEYYTRVRLCVFCTRLTLLVLLSN